MCKRNEESMRAWTNVSDMKRIVVECSLLWKWQCKLESIMEDVDWAIC